MQSMNQPLVPLRESVQIWSFFWTVFGHISHSYIFLFSYILILITLTAKRVEADLGLLQHLRWRLCNNRQPLTIITKNSILDVATVLDPPLEARNYRILWNFWLEKLTNPSPHLHDHSYQQKYQNKVWNMLKVNNKDARTTSLTSFWCLYCPL